MVMENLFMQMEIFMKENGQIIKLMVMECTVIIMGLLGMKVNLKMICSMVRE
jgi:hypothetical protein